MHVYLYSRIAVLGCACVCNIYVHLGGEAALSAHPKVSIEMCMCVTEGGRLVGVGGLINFQPPIGHSGSPPMNFLTGGKRKFALCAEIQLTSTLLIPRLTEQ